MRWKIYFTDISMSFIWENWFTLFVLGYSNSKDEYI